MSEMLQTPTPQISVGAITKADLEEAAGYGAPTYEEQFGTSSAPTGQPPGLQPTLAQLELEAAQAMARATGPQNYFTPGADPGFAAVQAELAEFKKKYGDGENEKGQLRRERDELMEAFNGLSAQFDAMRGSGFNGGGGQPQVPQFQPQYGMPLPNDPYLEVGDDDLIQGRQFRQYVDQKLAPMMLGVHNQAQAAMQRAVQLETQLLSQAKVASGITKLAEYRLAAKNPWLNNLPEAGKIAAMQSLLAAERAQQPPANGNGSSAPAANTQERILSRTTYIEGSNPQVADTSTAAIEAIQQRDFAKAMLLPEDDGSRARALRALGQKNGWGWGQPSDLAR